MWLVVSGLSLCSAITWLMEAMAVNLQDVYSYGVVLWELLAWEEPWGGARNSWQVGLCSRHHFLPMSLHYYWDYSCDPQTDRWIPFGPAGFPC